MQKLLVMSIKNFTFLLLLFLVVPDAKGQFISGYTINSSGKTLNGEQTRLTFTVGEVVGGKLSSAQFITYQGFINPEFFLLLAIEDDFEEGVSYWPNPTNGLVNIYSKYSQIKIIQVYDNQGRLIKEFNYKGQEIDLRSENDGLYFFRLINNKQYPINTFTIIKQ